MVLLNKLKMKNILLTLITATAFFLNNFVAHSQAKKPQLMIIPADNWMIQNGYEKTINSRGKVNMISITGVHY